MECIEITAANRAVAQENETGGHGHMRGLVRQ
jgi:hypothetical protein